MSKIVEERWKGSNKMSKGPVVNVENDNCRHSGFDVFVCLTFTIAAHPSQPHRPAIFPTYSHMNVGTLITAATSVIDTSHSFFSSAGGERLWALGRADGV